MVARLLWEQDAAGSNPVTSTNREPRRASRVRGSFCKKMFIYRLLSKYSLLFAKFSITKFPF